MQHQAAHTVGATPDAESDDDNLLDYCNNSAATAGREYSPAPVVGPCIVHTVAGRETLNYLSIHYDVTATDIRKANPGLSIGHAGSLEWCPTVKVPTTGGEKAPFRHCVAHHWCFEASGGSDGHAATAAAAAASGGKGGIRVARDKEGSGGKPPPDSSNCGSVATLSKILARVRQLTESGSAADCTYMRVKKLLMAEFGGDTFSAHKTDVVALLEAHAAATDAFAQLNAQLVAAPSSRKSHVPGACRDCGEPVPHGGLACTACGAVVRVTSSPASPPAPSEAGEASDAYGNPPSDRASVSPTATRGAMFSAAVLSPGPLTASFRPELVSTAIAAPIPLDANGRPVVKSIFPSLETAATGYIGGRGRDGGGAGARSGRSSTSTSPANFLAAFDATFSKARISAEKVIEATNTACLCCGIPLVPKAARPQSCPYYGLADPAAAAAAARKGEEEEARKEKERVQQRSFQPRGYPSLQDNALDDDELFEL